MKNSERPRQPAMADVIRRHFARTHDTMKTPTRKSSAPVLTFVLTVLFAIGGAVASNMTRGGSDDTPRAVGAASPDGSPRADAAGRR